MKIVMFRKHIDKIPFKLNGVSKEFIASYDSKYIPRVGEIISVTPDAYEEGCEPKNVKYGDYTVTKVIRSLRMNVNEDIILEVEPYNKIVFFNEGSSNWVADVDLVVNIEEEYESPEKKKARLEKQYWSEKNTHRRLPNGEIDN